MAVIRDKFVKPAPLVWALSVSSFTSLPTPSCHFLHKSATCMFVSFSSSSSQNKMYFRFVLLRTVQTLPPRVSNVSHPRGWTLKIRQSDTYVQTDMPDRVKCTRAVNCTAIVSLSLITRDKCINHILYNIKTKF